jgi:hypothetical protein
MNERLKQLAEQAGLSEGVFTRHKGIPCDLKGYSMLPDEMEKFAQLIVRECAHVADVADENKCEWIGGNILTHFGVEE